MNWKKNQKKKKRKKRTSPVYMEWKASNKNLCYFGNKLPLISNLHIFLSRKY